MCLAGLEVFRPPQASRTTPLGTTAQINLYLITRAYYPHCSLEVNIVSYLSELCSFRLRPPT